MADSSPAPDGADPQTVTSPLDSVPDDAVQADAPPVPGSVGGIGASAQAAATAAGLTEPLPDEVVQQQLATAATPRGVRFAVRVVDGQEVFFLYGLPDELVPDTEVAVRLASGATRTAKVGARYGEPDQKGMVLHYPVEQARLLAGRPGHVVYRPLTPEQVAEFKLDNKFVVVGTPDLFKVNTPVTVTLSNGGTKSETPVRQLPGVAQEGFVAWAVAPWSASAGVAMDKPSFAALKDEHGGGYGVVAPQGMIEVGKPLEVVRKDRTRVVITPGELLEVLPGDRALHRIDRAAKSPPAQPNSAAAAGAAAPTSPPA